MRVAGHAASFPSMCIAKGGGSCAYIYLGPVHMGEVISATEKTFRQVYKRYRALLRNSMKCIAFIWDKKFSRVPRSCFLTIMTKTPHEYIGVTYKYIRVTYEYIRVHTSNIRVHTRYIPVTYA